VERLILIEISRISRRSDKFKKIIKSENIGEIISVAIVTPRLFDKLWIYNPIHIMIGEKSQHCEDSKRKRK